MFEIPTGRLFQPLLYQYFRHGESLAVQTINPAAFQQQGE
jgi:hypothetical protein